MNKLDNNQRIGFYPNVDFTTKAKKPGMQSIKLTEANIKYLKTLQPGSRLYIYDNKFLAQNALAPHMHLLVPEGKPVSTVTETEDF